MCKSSEKLIQASLAEIGVQYSYPYALPIGDTASQPKSPPAMMVKKEPELHDDIPGLTLEDPGENRTNN